MLKSHSTLGEKFQIKDLEMVAAGGDLGKG